MKERFKFTVQYYDADANHTTNEFGYVVVTEGGYQEALSSVLQYYGEDAINKIYLEPDTDSNLIILGKEEKEKFDVNWAGPAINNGYW